MCLEIKPANAVANCQRQKNKFEKRMEPARNFIFYFVSRKNICPANTWTPQYWLLTEQKFIRQIQAGQFMTVIILIMINVNYN